MQNVIITGATGFVGSWLVQEILKNNINVTVVVRDKSKLLPEFLSHKKCTIIEKSLENIASNDFPNKKYDCFFHLAWSGVSAEKKNELSIQMDNIGFSLHAMEICSELKCEKMIATGTVAEYVFSKGIMDLNAKQSPNDYYGAAKVSVHYFLDVRARMLNQKFNWVVLPSTYGERRMDNNIITYTIKSLLQNEKPQYGNLSQMWDFLHVEDVVRAIRMIAEDGIPGKVYGIGSGEYKPLKTYICRIRDIIDEQAELGIGEIPSMSTKTVTSCVNIFDLVQDVGFERTIDFDTGIKRTIDYIRQYIE